MTAFAFYAALVVLVVVSRICAGKINPGYLLGGLFFGVYNEIALEFCWEYSSKLGPMVWRDIPLIIVVGWGIDTLLALSITDRIAKTRHIESRFSLLLCDVLIFAAFAFTNEWLMIKLGMWTYNFPFQETLFIQIHSFILLGAILSLSARRMQSVIEDIHSRR